MPDYDADSTGQAPLESLQAEIPSSTDAESSNPVVNLPGPGLQFDPAKFLQYVEEENLTEEQAGVLLRAIWDLVVSFVDLGFGLSPVQQALVDRLRRDPESASPASSGRVSSRDEFTKIVTSTNAARPDAAASKEDSRNTIWRAPRQSVRFWMRQRPPCIFASARPIS